MDDSSRWLYSILEVCEALSGDAKGSGDPVPPHMRADMIRWLRWRVSDDGWSPSAGPSWTHAYDRAVRSLADETLWMVDHADSIPGR